MCVKGSDQSCKYQILSASVINLTKKLELITFTINLYLFSLYTVSV